MWIEPNFRLDQENFYLEYLKKEDTVIDIGANIGTTGTIWLAGLLVSDGMPKGDTLRIALAHTGANLFMAVMLLPWVHHTGRYLGRFG